MLYLHYKFKLKGFKWKEIKYATSGESGVDLRSIYNYTIKPNTSALIETGLSLGFPNGYEIQIRSINDLVLKHSVVVLNQTSTIGSDYEVVVLLANFGSNEIEIKAGDKMSENHTGDMPPF